MDDTLQPQLDRIAGTRAAEDAVHAAFLDAARRCAAGWLSADVRRTVRPTEIANAAIHSAIRLARAAQHPIPADEFHTLVVTITRRKAAAAARQATATLRDARRTEGLEEEFHADAAAPSPADLASARELATEVTDWILAEPDDTRRLIRFFGLIQSEPPTDIRGVLDGLARTHPEVGFRVPALRTIQLELQAAREEARRRFDAD